MIDVKFTPGFSGKQNCPLDGFGLSHRRPRLHMRQRIGTAFGFKFSDQVIHNGIVLRVHPDTQACFANQFKGP